MFTGAFVLTCNSATPRAGLIFWCHICSAWRLSLSISRKAHVAGREPLLTCPSLVRQAVMDTEFWGTSIPALPQFLIGFPSATVTLYLSYSGFTELLWHVDKYLSSNLGHFQLFPLPSKNTAVHMLVPQTLSLGSWVSLSLSSTFSSLSLEGTMSIFKFHASRSSPSLEHTVSMVFFFLRKG